MLLSLNGCIQLDYVGAVDGPNGAIRLALYVVQREEDDIASIYETMVNVYATNDNTFSAILSISHATPVSAGMGSK